MAKKITRGLAKIEMGAIAGDGGMGTALSEIGYTVDNTAVMTTEEGTTQDFTVEEQDDPIETVETAKGKRVLTWSSYNVEPDVMVKLFGGTKTAGAAGAVATLGTITGGSGYTNGTYTNVPLTGGAGSGATADITVAGGAVTGVVIRNIGSGYATGNSLSASNTNLGGAGTGFAVAVGTTKTSGEIWEAPNTSPEFEYSIQITDKKGNVTQIPRASVSAKMQLNFQKTNLGQVDITATVLTPTKSGVSAIKIMYAA